MRKTMAEMKLSYLLEHQMSDKQYKIYRGAGFSEESAVHCQHKTFELLIEQGYVSLSGGDSTEGQLKALSDYGVELDFHPDYNQAKACIFKLIVKEGKDTRFIAIYNRDGEAYKAQNFGPEQGS